MRPQQTPYSASSGRHDFSVQKAVKIRFHRATTYSPTCILKTICAVSDTQTAEPRVRQQLAVHFILFLTIMSLLLEDTSIMSWELVCAR
jgi:hypothetical protein